MKKGRIINRAVKMLLCSLAYDSSLRVFFFFLLLLPLPPFSILSEATKDKTKLAFRSSYPKNLGVNSPFLIFIHLTSKHICRTRPEQDSYADVLGRGGCGEPSS